jgi:adenine-specific DNA-methyltransferase
LDCFCGSGTTLVAASNLNRKWIGVDSGDAAIETTLKRFAHGTTKLGNYSADKKLKQTKMFNVNKLISNFSLFSDAKKSPVLNAILNKWEKWSSF